MSNAHACLVLGAALSALAACTGVIGGDDPRVAAGAGAPGATAPQSTGAAATDIDPAGVYLRRLNGREYARTVADVFGITDDLSADLPPDSVVDGYDNNVLALATTGPLVEAFSKLATRVAKATLADAKRRVAAFGCEPSGADRDTCLATSLDRLGRRAYRRPLTAEERTDLLALAKLAAGDADPMAPAQLLLEGLLQSTSFLYRVEVGEPLADQPGRSRLTGYELATRMSYLFWGSSPDDALLDEASRGDLDAEAGIERSARRLLADPRARAAIESFQTQWLGLGKLETVSRSATYFPTWTNTLRSAMAEETRLLLADLTFRDGASFLDFLTARHSFVNAELAAHYGLPAPGGAGFVRVELPATANRAGILTHGSLLSVYSHSDTLAPILRGKFVRDVLLCEHPPPPPPGVPPASESTATSVRERLEQHRANPACAGCHEVMDPVGFGLERYDITGRYRAVDTAGRPLTGEGRLVGFDPPTFTGAVELGEKLRASPKVAACVVQNALRFAMGRSIADVDAPLIASAEERFRATQYDFRSMLVSLVTSKSFRTFKTMGGP